MIYPGEHSMSLEGNPSHHLQHCKNLNWLPFHRSLMCESCSLLAAVQIPCLWTWQFAYSVSWGSLWVDLSWIPSASGIWMSICILVFENFLWIAFLFSSLPCRLGLTGQMHLFLRWCRVDLLHSHALFFCVVPQDVRFQRICLRFHWYFLLRDQYCTSALYRTLSLWSSASRLLFSKI